jgi:hypothetical protein
MIGRLEIRRDVAGAAAEAKALAVTLRTLNLAHRLDARATAVSLRDQIVNPVRPALRPCLPPQAWAAGRLCQRRPVLFARNVARSRERPFGQRSARRECAW